MSYTTKHKKKAPPTKESPFLDSATDVVVLAIDRACGLFGVDYANVQPHSGAQANAAAFIALDKPSDTVLGMSLAHSGHLTHGAAPNFPGKHYHAVQYGLSPEPAKTTTRRSSAWRRATSPS